MQRRPDTVILPYGAGRDRKGTQSLPHVIRKDKNNMKVNSPRVIINARIMANKKWKNITRGKRTIPRGLSENFFQKVFVLNGSAVSVWIHVCYTFNNSLCPLRLCVYKNIFSFFWLWLVQVRLRRISL